MTHLLLTLLPNLGLLLLLLAAAYGYGALLLRALAPAGIGRAEHLTFALALGLGLLSLLLLLLGLGSLLYTVIIWLLIVLGVSLIAVQIPAMIRYPTPESEPPHADTPTAPPQSPHARSPAARAADWLVRGGLGLVVLLALGYGLLANALTPPIIYDVPAYHFAIPDIYLRENAVVYIPYILHSNWPLGSEMLFMLGLVLGSEKLAQLVTWVYALLTCAGLLLAGMRWLPRHGGLLAAALVCSVPMFTDLSGTGMVEVPLACYGLLAFVALWHWQANPEEGRGWLLLSALLAGCAASTKLTGAAAAMMLGLLALALELLARRPGNAVRVFALYGLVSLAVVLPWYYKAWALTGNPIWPFAHELLGGRNWDALGSDYLANYLATTSLPLTVHSWLGGLWHVTWDSAFRFGSYRLGPYLLLLLPVALLPLWREPPLRRLLLVLALLVLAFYTSWFFLTHQTRFLMPMVPFAALLAAAGVAWLWQWASLPLRVPLHLLLIGWLLAGAWVFDTYQSAAWSLRWPYLNGTIARAAYLSRIYPEYPIFAYANRTLPAEARVLLAPYEPRGYYLERDYMWLNPIAQRALPLEQLPDAAALAAALHDECITHILYNEAVVLRDIRHWGHIERLLHDMRANHARLLLQHDRARLYALDPPAGGYPPQCTVPAGTTGAPAAPDADARGTDSEATP